MFSGKINLWIFNFYLFLLYCDTELTGILKLWEKVDENLILIYSVVCFPFCICELKRTVLNQMKINFCTTIETYQYLSQYFNIGHFSTRILESIQEIYQSNPKY